TFCRMTPFPIPQQTLPAPQVAQLASTAAQLSAEIKSLELRIAEEIAAAKTLLAKITGLPPESKMTSVERAASTRMEQAYRALNTEIATNQAQLELLRVRLAQAIESHAADFPQVPLIVSPGGTVEVPPFLAPPPDRDAE